MADLKIFAKTIEDQALAQINQLVENSAFEDCKVRIMPDVHAGKGCVVGFTADLGKKVIPNIVGVDIGCGMLTVELGQINIDFKKFDAIIYESIPCGFNVHTHTFYTEEALQQLYCYNHLKNTERLCNSMGTLGGGNHFIEIDEDLEGNKYLIIHSGSRNLGKQVADYYQHIAIESFYGAKAFIHDQKELINFLKEQGREKEISEALKELRKTFQNSINIPKELCYLEGQNRLNYLHDMDLCQRFASLNRKSMGILICDIMGWQPISAFETIHNYIELETNMVRKGAISAKAGEKLLIPINMRDGCIIGYGKGNVDWNCSAPHGAGRLMSRSQARKELNLNEYQESMKGIYTTSVNEATLDEAPMAYKPIDEILDTIKDTIEVEKIIKPIYNFKASE